MFSSWQRVIAQLKTESAEEEKPGSLRPLTKAASRQGRGTSFVYLAHLGLGSDDKLRASHLETFTCPPTNTLTKHWRNNMDTVALR